MRAVSGIAARPGLLSAKSAPAHPLSERHRRQGQPGPLQSRTISPNTAVRLEGRSARRACRAASGRRAMPPHACAGPGGQPEHVTARLRATCTPARRPAATGASLGSAPPVTGGAARRRGGGQPGQGGAPAEAGRGAGAAGGCAGAAMAEGPHAGTEESRSALYLLWT